MDPANPGAWAEYGPLGLIAFVAITASWLLYKDMKAERREMRDEHRAERAEWTDKMVGAIEALERAIRDDKQG